MLREFSTCKKEFDNRCMNMRETTITLPGMLAQFVVGLVILLSIAACGGGSSESTQAPDQSLQFNLVVEITGSGRVTGNIGGVDCRANCQAAFNNNDQVTLTATADAGFVFQGWTGACSGTSTCTVTMNAQRTVGAVFVEQTSTQFQLTVVTSGMGTVTSSPSGINCGSDCSEEYAENTQVILTATPASGYLFSSWSGACSGSGACNVTMTSDLTVTANFVEEGGATHDLTVTVSGNGTVTSTPAGIQCGSDCSETYNESQSVSLVAVADSGFVFQSWSGDCSGSGSCDVTMSNDRSVTATFVAQSTTHELAVTVSGNGTVTSTPSGIQCGSDCEEDYNEGESVTLIATPDSGYLLDAWSGDCSGSAGCNLVMSQARAVTATFVEDTGQQADILIEDYFAPNDAFTISEVPNNASGITWHEDIQQYLVVRNNFATIYRYDVNFAYMGQLSVSSINSDTEGLGYVGGNEVMVVTENNFAHKLVIDGSTTTINGSPNVTQAYQPLPFSGVSNKGLEGVAVRKAETGQLARVYAVQEGTGLDSNALMRLVYFDIPEPDPLVLLSYDSNLDVVEPFDAEVAFAGRATDLAGLAYDERTGHLIVLSEEQSKALQVNPITGAIVSELPLTGAPQYEGVTIGPNGELVFVSEGNLIRIYELP